ncbi:hypothetical protein MDV075.5 [Gallid alphaherpesvirus 2]|uniref:Uncharacterized protein n=1 Tax=Gallid alphaherpesvirus 2 TaxID=10390 RepID=Q19B70_9ALPH|nr:hypothetical protein MDV006.3 [Gallid alphaherpesvirus 2]ABF72317.1 hypothetical protein MDV075.5 [Gallid alphaherpesvirus 2]
MFAETPAIYIIPSSFWDFPYTRFWLGSLPDLVSVSGSLNFTLPSKKKKRFGYPGSAPPRKNNHCCERSSIHHPGLCFGGSQFSQR